MKREEAINILKSKMDGSVDTSYEWTEAIRMAIKALTDRPTGLKLFEKIIVSHNTKGKPYYDIQYFDTEDGTHHIGYGSYNIQIIAKYLIIYFSI